MNQRFVPISRFPEICAVAERYQALGVQISHSGTVAGILFDSRHTSLESEAMARARVELQSLGVRPLGQFITAAEGRT